jgi:hypothetical protein
VNVAQDLRATDASPPNAGARRTGVHLQQCTLLHGSARASRVLEARHVARRGSATDASRGVDGRRMGGA